jgi:hypothetical protein
MYMSAAEMFPGNPQAQALAWPPVGGILRKSTGWWPQARM